MAPRTARSVDGDGEGDVPGARWASRLPDGRHRVGNGREVVSAEDQRSALAGDVERVVDFADGGRHARYVPPLGGSFAGFVNSPGTWYAA